MKKNLFMLIVLSSLFLSCENKREVELVEKIKQFEAIFGWYDKKTADMVFDKIEAMSESTLFSKQWWNESLELNEAIS